MRKGFGFHNRHSPFRLNPATFFGNAQGAWYDPSDLSTLFQDAAGTVPVTAIGDPVGRMLDNSGNGNHATQTSNASRPFLQQSDGLYHLTFDGSNDSLITNSINFTGTDKMTVFAGVRKLTNAAAGTFNCIVELGSGGAVGSFLLFAPDGVNNYTFSGNGSLFSPSTQAVSTAASIYNSPHTGVIACTGDISGDLNTMRVNGANIGQATGDQGTGNFGSYALNIGRRSNAILPFNGRIYGLIVLGAQATDW